MTISEEEICLLLSSLKEGRELSLFLTLFSLGVVLLPLWQNLGYGLQTVMVKETGFILSQNTVNIPWLGHQDPGYAKQHVPMWKQLQ